MRTVTDDERRARLGRRHALAPAAYVETPEAATRAMTVLHATEPATVHLSCWARVPGFGVDDLTTALEVERTLVKQLAMRRTLFVFPRDLLPAAWGSASARVAELERRRMVKEVVGAGLVVDGGGETWLERARAAVLEVVAASGEEGVAAADVRVALPELAGRVEVGAASWNHTRLLTHLGLSSEVVRGRNAGHWRVSRPRWTVMAHWLGEDLSPLPAVDGYVELVRRWLYTFGPGTVEDLQWWLGDTKAAVRAALTALDAVEVDLETPPGVVGWLLPDDLDPVTATEPWVALLPVLDPTVMGWRGREFYLGPHAPMLFDRNGNAGTTAWVDGRVVGCWTQDPGAVVSVRVLEEVTAVQARALRAAADRLTGWLAGERVGTVYPSAAMKDHTIGTSL